MSLWPVNALAEGRGMAGSTNDLVSYAAMMHCILPHVHNAQATEH